MIRRNSHFQARRERKKTAGQSTVEFILTIVFVLLLFVGIVESIVMIYTYTVLADAAKEGVRYAIVHGSEFDASVCSGPTCTDSGGDNVKAWVRNFLWASLHNPAAMTVNVAYPEGAGASTNSVRVTVSYPYQPLFGLRWPTVTVRAAAEGRIFY